MAYGADAAGPRCYAGHLIVGSPLREFLETTEVYYVEISILHRIIFVEVDSHFCMSFYPSNRSNHYFLCFFTHTSIFPPCSEPYHTATPLTRSLSDPPEADSLG